MQPFLVPPSNADGDAVVLACRVDPELKRTIDRITHEGIATHRYPWETPSDLMRWLLVAGLDRLVDAEDADGLGAAYREALAHAQDAQAQITQVQTLHGLIRDTMAEYVRMGQSDAAVTYIHQQMTRVLDMPESGPRSWLVHELEGAYAPFLAQAQKPASFATTTLPEVRREAKRRARSRRSPVATMSDRRRG